MLKNVYLGRWEKLEDVLYDYSVEKNVVDGYKVIVAAYTDEDYSGDAYVLLKKGYKYYEVFGGHCSCHGLEGQWDLEETAKAALQHRIKNGYHSGAFQIAIDSVKEHFGW